MERKHPYNQAQLQTFSEKFINRFDVYPIQRADGGYAAVRKPLTPEVILGHLQGIHTIGTYALSPNDTGKFLVIDADTDTVWEQILDMAAKLESRGVAVWRELSRRGGHLWFFIPPMPGVLIRRFAVQLLTENELYPPIIGEKPIEIYPRQVQLVQNGLGSLVRLPLGKHRVSEKVYPFVDRSLVPLAATPRELLPVLTEAKPVAMPFILSLIAKSSQIDIPKPTHPFVMREISPSSNLKPSEKIKARISTVEFIRQYVELDNQGKGYCPFHDDQHKSFNVVEQGDYWNCFAGCGGGDLIHFWQRWRAEHGQDGSFTETIKDLLELLRL